MLLGAVAALGLCPAIASAVVEVRVERVDVVPNGSQQVIPVEVFASNPDTAENERLNAYTIALEAVGFSAGGVRFQAPAADGSYPEPTSHAYVFGAYPGNGPVDPAGLSDAQHAFLSAALGGTGQEANISDTLNGFAKLFVIVPASVTQGSFPITIDPGFLSLGSAGTPITAVGVPGVVNIVPEPASLGLIALGGLFALRRRRVA
jgi:hypothetical protein